MKAPTIAIVVPNHNDSKYLPACLDSILGQSVAADQLVVVDDQSTDDSVPIIEARLRGFAGATLIRNAARLGTMGALNEGLKHVRCDYVLFLSSNDYLEAALVERAKANIASCGGVGLWSALVSVVDENGGNTRLYPSPVVALGDRFLPPRDCIRLASVVGHWFNGTTLVYHRHTLRSIGGFNPAYRGLADLFAALAIAGRHGAFFVPEPLGVMRQHGGSLMTGTLTDLAALDAILALAEEEGARLAPGLFTPQFCNLTWRRIRFTAMRATDGDHWQRYLRNWPGPRYRLLAQALPLLGKRRLPRLGLAFLILRPLADGIAIIRYRFLGIWLVRARQRLRSGR